MNPSPEAMRPPEAVRPHLFCAAPMMRYSHEQARYLWRLLCPPALLYTEMLTADAILHGARERLLPAVAPQQSPIALQLGGGCAKTLAAAAALGEEANYAEINLNCGCPSARVRQRDIGACLMADAPAVANMVGAMKRAVSLPVTVKCRLAIDGMNDGEDLTRFVRVVADGGCDGFIVHARRAWLNGLSPAQNRHTPPLNHERVWELKKTFPHLRIIINGGINDVEEAAAHLPAVDGVMLGRAVCRRPYLLAEAARRVFALPPLPRRAALSALLEYARALPPHKARRALTAAAGLYHGEANNKVFRRALAEGTLTEGTAGAAAEAQLWRWAA